MFLKENKLTGNNIWILRQQRVQDYVVKYTLTCCNDSLSTPFIFITLHSLHFHHGPPSRPLRCQIVPPSVESFQLSKNVFDESGGLSGTTTDSEK